MAACRRRGEWDPFERRNLPHQLASYFAMGRSNDWICCHFVHAFIEWMFKAAPDAGAGVHLTLSPVPESAVRVTVYARRVELTARFLSCYIGHINISYMARYMALARGNVATDRLHRVERDGRRYAEDSRTRRLRCALSDLART